MIFFVNTSSVIVGQHTFSIVAIDKETGEVGSAGATCLDGNDADDGAYIISDIVVGKGAVHTQSYWNPSNQSKANEYLNQDLPATDIISLLEQNDAQNNASIRQYGAVTFAGLPEEQAAAFTGDNCFDVKKHRVGSTFSVQGNILLNEGIVDSMYEKFNRSVGPLHERLMAALQGAKVPGADSRCLSEGVSSLSAFIRVARPGDSNDDLWMDLNINKTPFGVEPIDNLQGLYEEFLSTSDVDNINNIDTKLLVSPSPSDGLVSISAPWIAKGLLSISTINGESIIRTKPFNVSMGIDLSQYISGVYVVTLIDVLTGSRYSQKVVLVK